MRYCALFGVLLFVAGCSFFKPKQEIVPALKTLLDDIKLYKLEHPTTLHAGNLYEHLMWTHYAAARLFKEQSPWVGQFPFSERDKQLVMLAALLHDVGKAGRIELFNGTHGKLTYTPVTDNSGKVIRILYGHDHKEHVLAGFEYVAEAFYPYGQQRQYILSRAIPFSLQPIFTQLKISLEEQKTIAVMVGMHYDFGMMVNRGMSNEEYISRLRQYAEKVQLPVLTEKILRMCVLVHVADLMALNYVAPQPTWLFPHPEDYKAVRTIEPSAYERFGYNTDKPLKVFNALLACFHHLCNT